jgi:hypothetical protein
MTSFIAEIFTSNSEENDTPMLSLCELFGIEFCALFGICRALRRRRGWDRQTTSLSITGGESDSDQPYESSKRVAWIKSLLTFWAASRFLFPPTCG